MRPDALAFCFSGHGSQWLGMGRDLLGEPVFRAAFEACDRALRPFTGWSVTAELLADRATSRLERTDVVQPVLFALQTALARTLSAWGVEPAVVFGQGPGDVAAAVFAGALPLAEGARLIAARSRLDSERTHPGTWARRRVFARTGATTLRATLDRPSSSDRDSGAAVQLWQGVPYGKENRMTETPKNNRTDDEVADAVREKFKAALERKSQASRAKQAHEEGRAKVKNMGSPAGQKRNFRRKTG
ncbi:DUF5302 family protein [Streptomyces sp. NPDC057908]|uniref:DUF5302 family protein n=1 Tax=Streptomyces sp. NPDC057908 TaxID=3346276 RepID=UPI0036EE989B